MKQNNIETAKEFYNKDPMMCGGSERVYEIMVAYAQSLQPVVSEWISVSNKMPTLGMEVIVYDTDQEGMYVYYYDQSGKFYNMDLDENRTKSVTHWMPLPKPPK